MKDKKSFYITTPLYYPSGKWHLGHSYTTVCCDALARFKRMQGYEVFYLTGTDEHGQKIADRAAAEGKQPKEYVDGLVDEIKKLWGVLDISYDKFIRTTDDYHIKSVQKIFRTLYDKGDIYKGHYKGHYCKPCEAFWTASQLNGKNCPDCGRETIEAEEECYFFRLSKYADRIEKLLTETDFLEPKYRATEMLNSFIKPGLTDLAVSRTSVKWGIPVDFDPAHVVYVWIDALSNYTNALGYNGDNKNMNFWPADVHMVGKEIVRFHSIIWPALLMALDLPLPKKVYGHGWLLLEGDKMSKSKGNVADPFQLIDRYGIDTVRYYLLREVPFGSDGAYSLEAFLTRYNGDLVNDFGNLVKRTAAMANQYFGGESVVFAKGVDDDSDKELTDKIDGLKARVEKEMDGLSCSKALEEIFAVISRANKYIDQTTPWILFKAGNKERLMRVLYNLLEAVRVCGTLLIPFLPGGGARLFETLSLPLPADLENARYDCRSEYKNLKEAALYHRADIAKELASHNDSPKSEPKKEIEKKMTEEITIDDFAKVELKIAEVIAAEKVEKADKLLKIRVRLGDEERTVVSGIAKWYAPEELVGKKVVLVANLKPVKLRGIESQGMILAVTDGDNVVLLSPEKDVNSGSVVS